MKPKQKIILIGGGGHCSSVIDVIEQSNQFAIKGIIDKSENVGKSILGYTIIGSDSDIPQLLKKYKNFVVTVGHIKSNETRIRLFNEVKNMGGVFPPVISPRAYLSQHSFVDEGTVIMHDALVNTGVRIGRNAIINTGAIVEHDAVIGDNCHISTGTLVNGGCKIGDRSFIGSNAMIRQYVTIGEDVSVGASSVVMSDLESSGLYVGNPAILKRRVNG